MYWYEWIDMILSIFWVHLFFPLALMEIASNIKFNCRCMPGLITKAFHSRHIAASHWPKCLWLALVGLYVGSSNDKERNYWETAWLNSNSTTCLTMNMMKMRMKLQMLHFMARLCSWISTSQNLTRKKWLWDCREERQRGKRGEVKAKVITPEKILPYKCCLPSFYISRKKDFDTDVLFN